VQIYKERPLTDEERQKVLDNAGLIGLARRRYPRLADRAGADSEGIAALALCHAVQRHTEIMGALSTYAVSLIRGRWMDAVNREERRKWQVRRGVEFEPIGEFEPPGREASLALEFDEVEAIHAAVDSLSTARARSVRACLMLGMSCSEFASTLGISADAVKQTRRAGMEQLRLILSAQQEKK